MISQRFLYGFSKPDCYADFINFTTRLKLTKSKTERCNYDEEPGENLDAGGGYLRISWQTIFIRFIES